VLARTQVRSKLQSWVLVFACCVIVWD